jgi:hypothetical protein
MHGAGPVLPDYGGACLSSVMAAVLGRDAAGGLPPPWLPAAVVGARQVVMLVLDGLGWEQLRARAGLAPVLSAMEGGPITTVVPSTTATALTSLTTGATPAGHGMVGYRLRLPGGDVLNVLRWTTAQGDARRGVPPERMQRIEPFLGLKPPVVTRADFALSGFSTTHLPGVRLHGWRALSTLVVHVANLLGEGEPFVYAYYPGVDTVAHEYGFGPFYDAELAAADRLVGELVGVLPPGAALLVVSDHGQVDVGDRVRPLHGDVLALTSLLSGEGRFRWLHARPGFAERLAEVARRCHGDEAWVATRAQAEADGWFGGPLSPEVAARLGDVVLAAREPVAFLDPADTGEMRLICRHGSLTADEMLVPLLAAKA